MRTHTFFEWLSRSYTYRLMLTTLLKRSCATREIVIILMSDSLYLGEYHSSYIIYIFIRVDKKSTLMKFYFRYKHITRIKNEEEIKYE